MKGVATNLPVPVIGVNPLGVYYSAKDIHQSIISKRKHSWLFFLLQAKELRNKQTKSAKLLPKIRISVDPFNLAETYEDGSFSALPPAWEASAENKQ